MACVRFRRGAWGVDWRDATGRRRWKRCGSELEAERVLAAVEAERRDRPRPSSAGELTVSEYFELWLSEVRVRTKSQSAARYRQAFRLHVEPELGARPLSTVTRFELKRLLVRLHERGLGLHMVTRVLSMLFRSAYEDGLLERNPGHRLGRLFRVERAGSADVKALTRDELARFLRASAAEPVYDPLFRAMAYSGLRTGEARALRPRDVDASSLRLAVSRTFSGDELSDSPKSRRARLVEIPETLAAELEGLSRWRSSEAWLFSRARDGGEFLRAKTVRRAFRRALERAELPLHFTPHSLRHTYASLLIQQGARAEYVQRQLGHASITLTVDVYGRWLELSARPELEALVSSTERATAETVTDDEDELPLASNLLTFRPPRSSVVEGPRTSCSRSDDEDEPDDSEGSA